MFIQTDNTENRKSLPTGGVKPDTKKNLSMQWMTAVKPPELFKPYRCNNYIWTTIIQISSTIFCWFVANIDFRQGCPCKNSNIFYLSQAGKEDCMHEIFYFKDYSFKLWPSWNKHIHVAKWILQKLIEKTEEKC